MAKAIDPSRASSLLVDCLEYLKQDTDPALRQAKAPDVLAWGIAHWNPAKLAGIRELQEVTDPV